MNTIALIEKKRDGKALTPDEMEWLITGFTKGIIPDYQMAAWTMAAYLKGLTVEETAALTRAMARSGDRADLSSIPGIKVDKHSTGGVGDTVTLIAAPLAAAAGVPVAKMSGRSLGFTGGTADKLEAIPGYRTALSFDEFIRQVKTCGLAMASQSGDLAPADKKLYALRDATGTVASLPLIASSIMSKKIASGADAVVLDVKWGRGAFMKDRKHAERLMEVMTELGEHAGIRVISFLTDMNVPLGCAVGNSVEVDEAADILAGKPGGRRLKELSLLLAGAMILAGGKSGTLEEGKALARRLQRSGQGLAKWKECIRAQGGSTAWMGTRPLTPDTYKKDVLAAASGYIEDVDPLALAHVVMDMGGGRKTKDDVIDLHVGIRLWKEPGEAVKEGEMLLTVYGNDKTDLDAMARRAEEAVTIGGEKREFPLVYRMCGV